jgi:hypothetical protein
MKKNSCPPGLEPWIVQRVVYVVAVVIVAMVVVVVVML